MDLKTPTQPSVKHAIEALQSGDTQALISLSARDMTLFDDGCETDIDSFSRKAGEHKKFSAIDHNETQGLDALYDSYGNPRDYFKTFYKFSVNDEGKVSKLEINQAAY